MVDHHPVEAVTPTASTVTGTTDPVLPLTDPSDDFQARASREGKVAQEIAKAVLERAGFQIAGRNVRARGLGVTINLVALDALGNPWNFDVTGAFTTTRGGLLRSDSVWKSLGKASVLANNRYGCRPDDVHGPVVLLTSHLPRPGSDGERAMHRAGPTAFFDAIEMLSDDGQARLGEYATGVHRRPLVGFWSQADVDRSG